MNTNESKTTEYLLREQCPETGPREIKVHIVSENGQIWIQPQGYSEKNTEDGLGFPLGLEIWQGRLRLIVFADINEEDAQIIDLEKAREIARIRVE